MSKIYTVRKKVTYEIANFLGDEQIKRQLAHRLINDIELDDLNKLLFYSILDPRTDESKEKLINHLLSTEYDREQIVMNMREQTLQYGVTLRIPDKQKN